MELFYAIENNFYISMESLDKEEDLNIKNYVGDTLLIAACKKSDFDTISKLIKKGVNLDLQDRNGNTALIRLCEELHNCEAIDLLLENGCDMNIQNYYGETALHEACERYSFETANKLIDFGANVNIFDRDNWSALKHACNLKKEQLAIKIMNKASDLNFEKEDIYGNTVMTKIYDNKLVQVLDNLKLLYRNAILESIEDNQTIIAQSFNQFGDLNTIDIIIDLTY